MLLTIAAVLVILYIAGPFVLRVLADIFFEWL